MKISCKLQSLSPFAHRTRAFLLLQKALKFSVEPTVKKSISPHYPKAASFYFCLIITINWSLFELSRILKQTDMSPAQGQLVSY